jgi:hypothetical protein
VSGFDRATLKQPKTLCRIKTQKPKPRTNMEAQNCFYGMQASSLQKRSETATTTPTEKHPTYIIHVQTADNLKINKLLKILAMLSQTKVYIIWKKQST